MVTGEPSTTVNTFVKPTSQGERRLRGQSTRVNASRLTALLLDVLHSVGTLSADHLRPFQLLVSAQRCLFRRIRWF